MGLKPATKRALDAWLGADTWPTKHDADMGRWYDFVSQYQKDHGFTIDEAGLRELIEDKTRASGNEDLRRVIRERIGLAYSILDFLKHTGR